MLRDPYSYSRVLSSWNTCCFILMATMLSYLNYIKREHIRFGKKKTSRRWDSPSHANYYFVLHFKNHAVPLKTLPNLKENKNTFRAKICPLSDFLWLEVFWVEFYNQSILRFLIIDDWSLYDFLQLCFSLVGWGFNLYRLTVNISVNAFLLFILIG